MTRYTRFRSPALSCLLLPTVALTPALAQQPAARIANKPAAEAQKPAPDVLIFTNGDQLTGKLLSAAAGSVTFQSDMAGSVTVSLDKIKELRSSTIFVALKKAPDRTVPPAVTGTVVVEAKDVTVTPASGPTEQLPTSQLGYLVAPADFQKAIQPKNFLRGWTGTANFGATWVGSTTSSTTLTGSIAITRQIADVAWLPKRNRTVLNLSETYGTSSTPVIPPTTPATPPSVTETNIFHTDAERDQYINDRLYYLADLSFDHNYSSGLGLQQVYGIGIGWTAYQNARQELDLKGDLHYERQTFFSVAGATPSPDLELIGSTFQENFKRTLPKKVVLTETVNILPAYNDPEAYSANASLALTLPVWHNFAATVSSTDNYINNPAAYYRTNTVQFVTSLTYTIK